MSPTRITTESYETMTKIKNLVEGYINKALHLLERGKRVGRSPDSGSGTSAQLHHHDVNTTTPSLHLSPSTPPQQGQKEGDVEMDIEIEMSVEEAMDVSANEDEPKGGNGDADDDNKRRP